MRRPMSDARLGMTDLLNSGWFADDNGFDMHFPGARKRPVGETYAKLITPMPLKGRASAPPLPAVLLNLENQHEQTSRRLAGL